MVEDMMIREMVVAARLRDGYVVGYRVDKFNTRSTQDWLDGLPVVTDTWREPLEVYRGRRQFGKD